MLPACVSGWALIDGVNGSSLQPESVGEARSGAGACFQRASLSSMLPSGSLLPGSFQESATSDELSGSVHEPGSVRNGDSGGACAEEQLRVFADRCLQAFPAANLVVARIAGHAPERHRAGKQRRDL